MRWLLLCLLLRCVCWWLMSWLIEVLRIYVVIERSSLAKLVSPLWFCMIWCNPTSWMITRRLLAGTEHLKAPHIWLQYSILWSLFRLFIVMIAVVAVVMITVMLDAVDAVDAVVVVVVVVVSVIGAAWFIVTVAVNSCWDAFCDSRCDCCWDYCCDACCDCCCFLLQVVQLLLWLFSLFFSAGNSKHLQQNSKLHATHA